MNNNKFVILVSYGIIIAILFFSLHTLGSVGERNNKVIQKVAGMAIIDFDHGITLIEVELSKVYEAEGTEDEYTNLNPENIYHVYVLVRRSHDLLNEMKYLNKTFDLNLYYFHEYIRSLIYDGDKVQEQDLAALKRIADEGSRIRVPEDQLFIKKKSSIKVLNNIYPSAYLVEIFNNIEELSEIAYKNRL